jgi:ammonia channel protein AmtB
MVGGVAACAGAALLGPRLGRYDANGKPIPIPGHNVALAVLGTFLLWVGWYGECWRSALVVGAGGWRWWLALVVGAGGWCWWLVLVVGARADASAAP